MTTGVVTTRFYWLGTAEDTSVSVGGGTCVSVGGGGVSVGGTAVVGGTSVVGSGGVDEGVCELVGCWMIITVTVGPAVHTGVFGTTLGTLISFPDWI